MNLEHLKIKMILHYPFFGSLLHNIEHIESKRVPTAATDGNRTYYNPDFMDSLKVEEQLFVMAHELMHCAFMHVPRFKSFMGTGESAEVWNIAIDYLVNDLLVNEQKMVKPACGILNDKYKFKDWTSEQLYKELMKNVKIIKLSGSPGDGSGAGSGNDLQIPTDEHGNATHQSEAETQAQAKKWAIAVNEAATIAKKAGDCPESIERLIGELLKPKINWQSELQNWFNQKVKELNNWTVPNRRFVSKGIYLPSKKTEMIGHIVVAVDTSGSIGEYELTAFGSELNYIFETVKPTKVTVIYCDCAINRTEEFTREDFPITLKPYGGGGTDFRPPFNWIKKHIQEEDIAGLVYMTDMYGEFPAKSPNYPVLWMATSEIKAPFGDTVVYNLER